MSTKVTDLTAKSQGFIASDKFLVSKHVTQTSGVLVVGEEYTILDFNAGDNFSNVATVVSGTINTTGCVFIATGTTPTTYSNGSTLARYVSQNYAIADLGLAPKVYKALLTQTGTSAPVATVLVNTLSGTPVWSRSSAGTYVLTLASEWQTNKVFMPPFNTWNGTNVPVVPIYDGSGITGYYLLRITSVNTIELLVYDSGGSSSDFSTLDVDSIVLPTIEVYP